MTDKIASFKNVCSNSVYLKRIGICSGPKDEAYYPQCDLCSYGDHELQTPSHLISICPYFFELRAQIFGFYTLESPYTLPFSKMCQFLLQSDLVDLQWEDGVNHTT